MPAISRFIQTVAYQGLIFYEMEFLLYKLIPEIFKNGNNPYPTAGLFYKFDYFDVMIIMDFMTFLSTLMFILIYLVTALYPTPNVKMILFLEDEVETKDGRFIPGETYTKDFLDSHHKERFTFIQLFSYFVLSIGIVVVCYYD